MPKARFHIETTLSPDEVLAAYTDFSPGRPDLWPGLSRKYYEVYSVGETTADVREGSDGVNIWARERYDWSQPGVILVTVQESNFSTVGDGVRITLEPAASGTTLHVDWWRKGANLKGKLLVGLLGLLRGKPVGKSIEKALRGLEKRKLEAATSQG